ncbi:MAG: hypothetical protein KatS3mg030_592 [Saprospiraceae bacterium]|nr:MAG: hypothetical protein KatS3mg030_592 [Saprospiraceae bacterium]
MNVLENITAEKILNEEIPISVLLDNSFYYPASGLDGGIVKYYGKEIQSFIYCDYAVGEEDLVSHLNDFWDIGFWPIDLSGRMNSFQMVGKCSSLQASACKHIINTEKHSWSLMPIGQFMKERAVFQIVMDQKGLV